jgi:hypothetical protein
MSIMVNEILTKKIDKFKVYNLEMRKTFTSKFKVKQQLREILKILSKNSYTFYLLVSLIII